MEAVGVESAARRKKPKRKVKTKPIAAVRAGSRSTISSLKVARKVTSRFHALTQEEARVRANASLSRAEREAKLSEVQRELAEMGGREAYQDASLATTSEFRTSRFVFQQITRLGLRPASGEAPLRVFEVGAINPQLLVCPWLKVRAIDLISRDRRIEEVDFFAVPPAAAFDAVVCAMVINCVPEARQRGEMLVRMNLHLDRVGPGLLFLMLPRRCVFESPYMTEALFFRALTVAGFEVFERRETPKILLLGLRRSKTAPFVARLARLLDLPVVADADADEADGRPSADESRWASEVVAHFPHPPRVVAPSVRGAGDVTQFAISFGPGVARSTSGLREAEEDEEGGEGGGRGGGAVRKRKERVGGGDGRERAPKRERSGRGDE